MWEIQADGKRSSGEATMQVMEVDMEVMEVEVMEVEVEVDMGDTEIIVIRVAQDMESPRRVPWRLCPLWLCPL